MGKDPDLSAVFQQGENTSLQGLTKQEGRSIWGGGRDIQMQLKFSECLFIFDIILTAFHYHLHFANYLEDIFRDLKYLTKGHTAR